MVHTGYRVSKTIQVMFAYRNCSPQAIRISSSINCTSRVSVCAVLLRANGMWYDITFCIYDSWYQYSSAWRMRMTFNSQWRMHALAHHCFVQWMLSHFYTPQFLICDMIPQITIWNFNILMFTFSRKCSLRCHLQRFKFHTLCDTRICIYNFGWNIMARRSWRDICVSQIYMSYIYAIHSVEFWRGFFDV